MVMQYTITLTEKQLALLKDTLHIQISIEEDHLENNLDSLERRTVKGIIRDLKALQKKLNGGDEYDNR